MEVDLLLDRGERFLAQRANILLEVDLENLVYLWNSYTEGLKELHASSFPKNNSEESLKIEKELKDSSKGQTKNQLKRVFPLSAESKSVFDKINTSSSTEECNSSFGTEKDNFDIDEEANFARNLDVSFGSEDSDKEIPVLNLKDLLPQDENLIIDDFSFPEVTNTQINHPLDTSEGKISAELVHSDKDTSKNGEAKYFTEVDKSQKSSDVAASTSNMEEDLECRFQSSSEAMEYDDVCASSTNQNKEDSLSPCSSFPKDLADIDSDTSSKSDNGCIPTFDAQTMKLLESSVSAVKRRRTIQDGLSNTSTLSSRSGSPLSVENSLNNTPSTTPNGTLKKGERRGQLWKAFNNIDTLIMDKEIIEACKVSVIKCVVKSTVILVIIFII